MIKDGAALEKLSAVDTVIFDKTGTLTRGQPQLVSPLMVSTETLMLAAGLAQASKHPLSQALVREAARRGLTPLSVSEIAEHPGLGLSVSVPRVLELDESFVIPCLRGDSSGGRRCGRKRTVPGMIAMGCVIPVI
jgi:Cu2+-exporting ATPase